MLDEVTVLSLSNLSDKDVLDTSRPEYKSVGDTVG